MFNNVFSKEANPILVNFWRTLPANLYNEAINALKIWCENNEISFAFKGEIEEAPCIGLIVQVEDGLEEIVGWKELDEMGLVFALNYKLFMPNKHRIVVNYKTSESPGFQVNEHY
ncbi:hypothetical protein ACLI10_15040, partial [Enterococcus faecalis]